MADEEQNPPERVLLAVTSFLLVATFLFAAVRVWAKTSQQLWSYFDAVFTVAFLACAAQCTTIYLAIAQYGFGLNGIDAAIANESPWLKAMYASDVLYLISVGLTRCSTAWFLSTLTRAQQQKIIAIVIATLAATWTVGSVFAVAMRGSLSHPWLTLEPSVVRWIGVEASGLALELACWLFAVNLVWTLNMPLGRRLRLIFLFALRLLLAPMVALRLYHLSPSKFHGSISDFVTVLVFTQISMHFALIAECLTCLRPFMQTFHEGLAPGNSTNYWGGISHVSNPGASHGSGMEREMKNHIRVTADQIPDGEGHGHGYKRRYRNGDGSMQLRSDRSEFSTRIESKRDLDDAWMHEGDDDIELLPTHRSIHVRQTTTMSVANM